MKIGFTLSSEEFDPLTLLKLGELADKVGFNFLTISDHYHPWVDNQGQSPFVWSTIGGLSKVTKQVKIMTAVTCPIIRIHPGVIAQAAATSQYMLEGRFILGVGTGENLNEHIVGEGWPPFPVRIEMLKEAVYIMRLLWKGGYKSYFGNYYTLDSARIYTLPKEKIPIIVASSGPKSTKIAGKIGDGFTTTSPQKDLIKEFEKNGGRSKPKYGQMSVCFEKDEKKAKELVKKIWPIAGIPSPLNYEIKLPLHFEKAAKLIRSEDVVSDMPIGGSSTKILEAIKKYEKAGFTHVYIHNIGPNQEEFIRFAEKEILPNFD